MHLIYEQLKKAYMADKTMSHGNYKREEVKEDIESVLRGWEKTTTMYSSVYLIFCDIKPILTF